MLAGLDGAWLGWQLFEHSPDCIMLLGGDGCILAVNRQGRGDFAAGMPEGGVGTSWAACWPAASRAVVDAALLDVAGTGGVAWRASRPGADGTLRWWQVTLAPLDAGGAQGPCLLAVMRDVSAEVAAAAERARLLREVQVAHERMNDLFRKAPAFMCVMRGPDHVIEMVNERYVQLVGPRELLGRPVAEAFPEIDAVGFKRVAERIYRTGEPHAGTDRPVLLQRERGAAPERRFLDMVFLPLRDADGRVTGLLLHGVDQTERKLAEIELYESRERFRKIVSQAATGVVELDASGRIALVNRKYAEMLGYEPTELVGRNVLEVTAPDSVDKTRETIGKLLVDGVEAVIDKHYLRKDGSTMPATSSVNALRGPDGEFQGLVAIVLDTTASRQAAETLRQLAADLAEADRRKTEFLATLAHELRNPLAPIRSGLAVMRQGGGDPAAVARVRDIMERQVGHMVHLIDDLLDIARISGGKLELKKTRADLAAVLTSAIETSLPMIEASRHELQVDLGSEALPADVDVTRIAQVVANLLNNAAKYTPAGGRIVLTMRREGGDALVSVADTGVGIPHEALEGVFDMFSQIGRNLDRSQGGLGIGLSLVRRVVELHGGSVVAASGGIGAGSTFTVRLPLALPAAEDGIAVARAEERAADAGGIRVLVADDNVDAAVTLSMLLELGGHATRVVHDGVDAVAAAPAFAPRLAFLDIGMPRMDGYAAARAMRALPGLEGLVLVALTGWGTEEDRRRSREAGFDHHLTKPVQMEEIARILAAL